MFVIDPHQTTYYTIKNNIGVQLRKRATWGVVYIVDHEDVPCQRTFFSIVTLPYSDF